MAEKLRKEKVEVKKYVKTSFASLSESVKEEAIKNIREKEVAAQEAKRMAKQKAEDVIFADKFVLAMKELEMLPVPVAAQSPPPSPPPPPPAAGVGPPQLPGPTAAGAGTVR